jgi:hypothetical protein
MKDSAMVMGSFTQMLLKKIPSVLDANPDGLQHCNDHTLD